MTSSYAAELYTGIRPTGDLTIANYVGAVKPLVELQKTGSKSLVFVADMHSLTDNEPSVANRYCKEVVADYLALGLDSASTQIYIQSDIAFQVSYMTILLSRHVSASELLRVPTLKDKIKNGSRADNANALLLLYPVMMAADILLQRAKNVPVGEDQIAHLEITRRIARSFNSRYGDVLPIPEVQQIKSLRILSLKGGGKMSKSLPDGAIFLTDKADVVAKKIMSAETAIEGTMSDSLQSHIILTKEICNDASICLEIDQIIDQHLNGRLVMGKFKKLMSEVVIDFLTSFQGRRLDVVKHDTYIDRILKHGAFVAASNANETLALMKSAME